MLIKYHCPACDCKMEFDCTPIIPGKYDGEPGACYPDDGGDVDGPDTCPECGEPVNTDNVFLEFERQT